jgi:hypothetical protein
MAGPVGFWQRVNNLFRPAASAGDDGLTPRDESGAAGGTLMARPPEAAVQRPVFAWWRRGRNSPQVREVSLRVVELAHSLQEHFEQQERRAAEVSNSLNRVGGTLEQLAESQRAHGDFLRSIAEHTEAAGKNAATLTTTLSRVPESLLAQAEAIRTVARSLEVSQEADTQLMHSLQQFGRAVDTLGSSGAAQVDILQRLTAAQQAQHDAFAALAREQSKRFLVVVVVTGVLALAALGTLIAMLVMRIS